MVTDDALKLDYPSSSTLESKSLKPNLIVSSQLLPAIGPYAMSVEVHILARLAQPTQGTIVYSIDNSQDSEGLCSGASMVR